MTAAVFIGDRQLAGRPQSLRLIALLLASSGQSMDREAMRVHFGWPAEKTRVSAAVAVHHARDALARAGGVATIESVFGRGYRLRVPS